MTKKLIQYLILILSIAITGIELKAQTTFEGKVSVDKTVHNFGDIIDGSGPVSCTYEFTNISEKPILLLSVVTSCGCTDADWTKEPILPGKTGTVSTTYSNEDGPYPFDKTATVYVSDLNKPIVLHLKGTVIKAAQPLKDRYTLMFNNFGVKSLDNKIGNLSQGQSKTVEYTVANNGNEPLTVEFENVSQGLSVKVAPNPIPPMSTSVMTCTVKANVHLYGKNYYYCTPVINGQKYKSVGELPASESTPYYTDINSRLTPGKYELGFWAITKSNFDRYTSVEKKDMSNVQFTKSTMDFGNVKSGEKATVAFKYKNSGKRPFHIYKLDSSTSKVKVVEMNDTDGGQEGTIVLDINTAGMDKGEKTILIELYTNSPDRPVISLQLTGKII